MRRKGRWTEGEEEGKEGKEEEDGEREAYFQLVDEFCCAGSPDVQNAVWCVGRDKVGATLLPTYHGDLNLAGVWRGPGGCGHVQR